MTRTIMIMAGGTGGHVFPAIAVAEYLRRLQWNIIWLGTRAGMEATLVPKHDIPLATLRFSGVRGKGFLRLARLPFDMILALVQSLGEFLKHRPDVVLGMGGFAAFPGGLAAWLLRSPLVIHEQNAVAGLTNKLLARLATRVLVAFPNAFKTECGPRLHTEWTGNPVREEIGQIPPPALRYGQRQGRLNVLVVGGSLGAAALNEVMPKALVLLAENERPQVVHQAGAKHIAALEAHYREAGATAELVPFIDDMAGRYAWADLVVCRAGALTIAELASAGVASVLVPYPHAVDDHQTENARFLSERGAAEVIRQDALTPQMLAALLQSMTRDKLQAMAEAARTVAKPEATRAVAEVCMALGQA